MRTPLRRLLRLTPLLIAAVLTQSAQAIPGLEPRAEGGVVVNVPAGWKALITPDEHNVTMSKDTFNQIVLHWYPWKDGVSKDKMLDLVVTKTNESLKVGTFDEESRVDILGGKGRMASGTWTGPLGYTMKMGFSVVLDQPNGRIVSAVFLASPEGWTSLGGGDLLTAVSNGLTAVP